MYELANQYMRQVKVPKVLINGAISVLRKSVQKKGNFDIRCVGRALNPTYGDPALSTLCEIVPSHATSGELYLILTPYSYCRST